jgi:large subunit ribosomal protein L25
MAQKDTTTTQRLTLTAKTRTVQGTRAARRMRREGFIPAVVYGKAVDPTPLVVNRRDLVKLLHAQAAEHSLVTLRVEADPALLEQSAGAQGSQKGGEPWQKPVLIKRVEHDPVYGEIIHVDLHAIALTEAIRIKIPIVLNGEPVGVKQDGGILEHFLREVEVECLPTEIPKQAEHDVSRLLIGDTIHVRDLAAPPGARFTADVEAVIASVIAPKEEKVEEVAEAITEPEVIREKKPEAEEEKLPEEKGEKKEKKEEKKEAKAEKPEAKEEKR